MTLFEDRKVCNSQFEPRITRGRKKKTEVSNISEKNRPKIDVPIYANELNKEIKKMTSIVRGIKGQQKTFSNKVHFIEESLQNTKKKKLVVGCPDEQTIYNSLKFLTVILVSMMFEEDKKVISYQELLKLFQAYRFGFRNVQLELINQGCQPTLQVISCIEKVMENPVESNLREFISVYKECSDKGKTKTLKRLSVLGRSINKKNLLNLLFGFVISALIY